MEKKQFTPRETIPAKRLKWYLKKGYGDGVSPCILGKPSYENGSVLSNCVGYAFSRFAEMHGEVINVGCWGKDYPASAQNWWEAPDGLERGQQIRLGAVACWKKNGKGDGHVAIVERIVNNGTECFLSDSAYNGAFFRYYPFTSDMKKAGYIFQGFIYPKYDFYIEEKKSVDEIAQEVIDGKWGVQPDRQKRLVQAGYDYYEVQNKVNEILWEQKSYYTVQQGDTLIKIGKKVGVPWTTISKLNNMSVKDWFNLYKGQKLRIR